MLITRSVGVTALLLVAAPVAAQVTPVVTDTSRRAAAPLVVDSAGLRRDTVVTPSADQGRGIDSELRIALFELANDRLFSALSRLEWLRTAPVGADSAAAAGSGGSGAAPAGWRDELIFLLSQTYYHLGVSDAFRSAAQQVLGGSRASRFASLLGSQLMLDAYRRGEFARVQELAGGAGAAGDQGLSSLIAGLSRYHSRDFAGARAAFGAAVTAGGPYAPYAQYMDALSMLQGDTLQAAAALEALRAMSTTATGELADQARLTAAELAYQAGQYDVAASVAAEVPAASGLAAQATLTRAWALYRARQVDSAGAAFSSFASRYPFLLERDEARVMVGQVMLEAGRMEEAGRYFDAMADSIAAEARVIQAASSGALSEAARVLVAARAAGVVFAYEPQSGKSVAVPDSSGAYRDMLLAAYSGAPMPAPGAAATPELISVTDVEARLASLGPVLGPSFPRRVVYAAASPEAMPGFARRSEDLRAADAAVAVARHRLQEQLDGQAAKIAAMQRLHFLVGEGNAGLSQVAQRLEANQDSLTRMIAVLDASRARVRQFIQEQADAARQIAAENLRQLDSVRTSLAATSSPSDNEVLALERQTAEYYRQMSDAVASRLDSAIARHPVFALHDSVQGRLARSRTLLRETRDVMASTDRLAGGELARLQAAESERIRALRGTLTTAEARRQAAESQLVSLLDAELRARASRVVARLQRDTEAAEFGSASALFFRAIETGGPTASSPTGAGGNGMVGSGAIGNRAIGSGLSAGRGAPARSGAP